jgi:hypothetical protein
LEIAMRWQLPTALLVSALMLSATTLYSSLNDHRSRWCVAMAKRVPFTDLRAAGDFMKQRTVLDWSDEEYGFGFSLEECRRSLLVGR